jgi:hypothetical protein
MRPFCDFGQPSTQSEMYSTLSGPKVTSVGNTPPMNCSLLVGTKVAPLCLIV